MGKKIKNRKKKIVGKKQFVSRSEQETMEIAEGFTWTLHGGEVVLLEGELGSGKSTFVRGMARAFGICEPIRSPTFTLMHVHPIANGKWQVMNGKTKKTNRNRTIRHTSYAIRQLAHVDAYRLRGAADLRAIGIGEYLGRDDTVVVIEWGERANELVKDIPARKIFFKHGAHSLERFISI